MCPGKGSQKVHAVCVWCRPPPDKPPSGSLEVHPFCLMPVWVAPLVFPVLEINCQSLIMCSMSGMGRLLDAEDKKAATNPDNPKWGHNTDTVPVNRLDDLVKEVPWILKIDVEGMRPAGQGAGMLACIVAMQSNGTNGAVCCSTLHASPVAPGVDQICT